MKVLYERLNRHLHQLIRLERLKNHYLKHGLWSEVNRLCEIEYPLVHEVLQLDGRAFAEESIDSSKVKDNFDRFKEIYFLNRLLYEEVGVLCRSSSLGFSEGFQGTYGKNGKRTLLRDRSHHLYHMKI